MQHWPTPPASWFPLWILDALRRSQPYLLESTGVLHFSTYGIFLCLQRHRLGVQRSSIYAMLAVMMPSSIFHTIVASIIEFYVSRVAVSSSESHGHWFDEAGSSNYWALNRLNLGRQMKSWEVTFALNSYATYAEVIGRRWVFIPPHSLHLSLLSSKPLLVSPCG